MDMGVTVVWIVYWYPCCIGNHCKKDSVHFSSVAQSCATLCDPMDCSIPGFPVHHSCPCPTPGAYANSCPSSWWCYPTISSSVIPLSSCLQSFPELRSFPMSQFFTSGGQSIGISASASVLPMNIQDWFPLFYLFIFFKLVSFTLFPL